MLDLPLCWGPSVVPKGGHVYHFSWRQSESRKFERLDVCQTPWHDMTGLLQPKSLHLMADSHDKFSPSHVLQITQPAPLNGATVSVGICSSVASAGTVSRWAAHVGCELCKSHAFCACCHTWDMAVLKGPQASAAVPATAMLS